MNPLYMLMNRKNIPGFGLLLLLCLQAIQQVVWSAGPPQAAVVTAHPLATQAGIDILQEGGNAFDAAVAITATLGVVEPNGSGLGGGGFWLLYTADNDRVVMVDGRETAPALARKNLYLDERENVKSGASINGPTAAGIPGIPAGLEFITDHYGTLPLSKTLAPAIRHAAEGFEVTERYRKFVGFRTELLKDTTAGEVFLKKNQVPDIDDKIVQNDLAETLTLIAKNGVKAFYRGELAVKMVDAVRKAGGIWTLKDLEDYRIQLRAPTVFNYRNIKVISAAPPSSGGIVLAQAFGILEHFNLSDYDKTTRKHLIIEAMRRAYRDRAVYLGDPDHVKIPYAKLLDHDYLEGLALTIDPEQATPSSVLGEVPELVQAGTSTTHFSVIDQYGNRVAATLSINLPFGSGFMVPGTGILLNDEMDDFSIKPDYPNAYGLVGDEANAIAPGKRPLSSMSPTFLETHDRVAILGTPGGSRIISMIMLAILDFAEGHTPASWVSQPRYHHQYLPDEVQFEPETFNESEKNRLTQLGHVLVNKNRQYGNMQAILWDKEVNKVYVASDPRGEGTAQLLY